MTHLEILGQHVVILNLAHTTIEMLEEKSLISSDCPVVPIGSELVGWKESLVLLPYGDRFCMHCKNFYHVLGSHMADSVYHTVEEEETIKFLQNVLAKPADLNVHLQRHVKSVTSNLLECKTSAEEEHDIKWTTGTMFAGGADSCCWGGDNLAWTSPHPFICAQIPTLGCHTRHSAQVMCDVEMREEGPWELTYPGQQETEWSTKAPKPTDKPTRQNCGHSIKFAPKMHLRQDQSLPMSSKQQDNSQCTWSTAQCTNQMSYNTGQIAGADPECCKHRTPATVHMGALQVTTGQMAALYTKSQAQMTWHTHSTTGLTMYGTMARGT
ncbi:hypothetical protein EDC04DRAFT_3009221 [Pisolithus marmoratus]|nr:hypothetical protein EDC04DRAFT_3009221 [Pisolithus marmoratus]